MSSLSRRDTLYALFVILVWGAHFGVIKLGVGEIGPSLSLTLRFGLTALLFTPFMRWPGFETFKKIAVVGLFMGVFHQGLLFVALRMLDSASVAVLLQSQTIFAVLMGRFLLGEHFGWRTMTGLLIGACGLVVMLGVPDVAGNLFGFALAILSAFMIAFSYIRMRQLSSVHAPTFIAIINLVSFPFVLAGGLMFEGLDGWKTAAAHANWYIVAGVLAYQVLLVSFTHSLWQKLLSRNEVARVTCYTLAMPVVAIIVGILFLGTPLSANLFIGTGLIVAGLAVVVIRRVQKKREEPIVIIE